MDSYLKAVAGWLLPYRVVFVWLRALALRHVNFVDMACALVIDFQNPKNAKGKD